MRPSGVVRSHERAGIGRVEVEGVAGHRQIVASRCGSGAHLGRMMRVRYAAGTRSTRTSAGLPTPFAEAVLDLVARIPRGRVMAYGQVSAALGQGGARSVGTVMARFGGGVPWHRVVRSDGSPPMGHESQALARYRAEGTPMVADGSRVDMSRACWDGMSDGRGKVGV